MSDHLETRKVHRLDYRPPTHDVETVELSFELDPERTLVHSRLEVVRRSEDPDLPLLLDGEDLETLALRVNGADHPVRIEGQKLRVDCPEARFEVETTVAIAPAENTRLTGLYLSSGNFCTQCEAQGFRRITWMLDRPDVLARYRVSLEAEREAFPVLLCNGNRVGEETLEGGRHRVRWEDPFPKPSYLFALVGGRLHRHEGTFTTRSGREVRLEIWVEPRNHDRCEHALRSLQAAMAWDEERFGLEYDLDLYMIVAVDDFNMGAMENKGLNVFNSKYVLARPDVATDDDYEHIEAVIGHEYFHNWTGNRVTLRDWFQLTLKEGLTVFRDQEFTADRTSADLKRITDVTMLRSLQFAEDMGPMAHPVRPESYERIDNFYTVTVYEKGAEIVRMLQVLLGRDGFRQGLSRYLQDHDGQAATCEDFLAAMERATGRDLSQFARWYGRAGTPVLRASWRRDADGFHLELEQESRGAEKEGPLHIPVAIGLLDRSGHEVALRLEGEAAAGAPRRRVLELTEAQHAFHFPDVKEEVTPSLLSGFSAPVRLEAPLTGADLAHLHAHDPDSFNRWDAGQRIARQVILASARRAREGGEPEPPPRSFILAWGSILRDPALDASLAAAMLALPTEKTLAQEVAEVDPKALHEARRHLLRALARHHEDTLYEVYNSLDDPGPRRSDATGVAHRRLRNRALATLCSLERNDDAERAFRHYEQARCMTERQAALNMLCGLVHPRREEALDHFFRLHRSDPLVLDKWFSAQALSRAADTLDRVEALLEHEAFTLRNPNRARSLVGAFAAGNQLHFHDASGRGYALLTRVLLEIDVLNPQLAARLASPFLPWRRFEPGRRAHMEAALRELATSVRSPDLREIVNRALAETGAG